MMVNNSRKEFEHDIVEIIITSCLIVENMASSINPFLVKKKFESNELKNEIITNDLENDKDVPASEHKPERQVRRMILSRSIKRQTSDIFSSKTSLSRMARIIINFLLFVRRYGSSQPWLRSTIAVKPFHKFFLLTTLLTFVHSSPSSSPMKGPSLAPSVKRTSTPSAKPSPRVMPSRKPTAKPSNRLSSRPSDNGTSKPSAVPTVKKMIKPTRPLLGFGLRLMKSSSSSSSRPPTKRPISPPTKRPVSKKPTIPRPTRKPVTR